MKSFEVSQKGVDTVERKRKKLKIALHLAILGFLAGNPEASAAGKREAARIAEGLKISYTEPIKVADVRNPENEYTHVRWTVRE